MQRFRSRQHSHDPRRTLTVFASVLLVSAMAGAGANAYAAEPPPSSRYWVAATFSDAAGALNVAVDHTGATVYVAHHRVMNPGFVTVMEGATGRTRAVIGTGMGTNNVILNAGANRLYATNNGGTGDPASPGTGPGSVQVIDTKTNTVIKTISTDRGASYMSLSPEGGSLYVSMYNGRNVTVIDTITGAIVGKVVLDGYPGALALNDDGTVLYAANVYSGAVSVISTKALKVTGTLHSGCNQSERLALNPSGTKIYMPCDYISGDVGIIDTATGSHRTVKTTGLPTAVAFAPDGRKAFISDYRDNGHISVVDTATENVASVFAVGPLPASLTVSPDGSTLYAVDYSAQNGQISRIDLTGTRHRTFTDVPEDSPFFHEIGWLANSNIATGFPDGSYRPEQPVHRDTAAAFLYRLAGSPEFTPPVVSPFADLSPSDLFYKEVAWAASEKISVGYPDRTFRPTDPLSREAAAAFLYRFATTLRWAPAFSPPPTPPFSDVNAASPFYTEVCWAAWYGVSAGYADGTFRPAEPVQRGAMGAFLYRETNADPKPQ